MNPRLAYHLAELEIARSASDPRRSLPAIPENAGRVLDVGCGMGQTLVCLKGECQRIGVDLDREAVFAGGSSTTGIDFAVAEGQRMPFANASFDFLICRVSLPYMPIRPSLQEFHRVLTPGGGVWIVLNSIDVPRQRLMESLRKGQLKDVLFQLYVMGNGLVFHLFGTILRFPAGHGRWESCQTVSGTERALEAAGFSSIAVHRAGRAIVCSANKRAGG